MEQQSAQVVMAAWLDLQASTPIACDFVLLPEIPLDSSRDEDYNTSGEHSQYGLRMERQSLNPCGMDNVLLLQDLPLLAADQGGFLLSIASCKATLFPEESRIMGSLASEPTLVSVSAVPSTFSFRLDSTDAIKETSSAPPGGVEMMESVAMSSTELDVVFDMTSALHHVERLWQELSQSNKNGGDGDDVPPEVESSTAAPSPANDHIRDYATCGDHSSAHDELLLLLRDLAAEEVRDLHRMLGGLGVIFVLLVLLYVKALLPLVYQPKKSRSGERHSRRHFVATRGGFFSNTGEPCDNGRKDDTRVDRPPVETVSVEHNSDAMTPLSEPPTILPKPSEEHLAPTGVSCSYQCPVTDAMTGCVPTDLSGFIGRKQDECSSDDGLHCKDSTAATRKRLSPCSKLANKWKQSKASRRGKREANEGSGVRLVPIRKPGDLMRTSQTGTLKPSGDREQGISPDTKSIATSASTPQARAPNDAPPFSLEKKLLVVASEGHESFLRDYWGD